MKKFSRILKYIFQYKGKLIVYLLFTLLATFFSLISLGMLSPFMELLFKSGEVAKQATLDSNAIGSLKTIIADIIKQDKIKGLVVICIFIIVSTFLKNLF